MLPCNFRLIPVYLAAVAFLFTPSADAYLIDNGAPDVGTTWLSDSGAGNNNRQVADDFTLAQGGTLTALEWWGVYLYGNTPMADNFTIRIFADNGGVPDTTPHNTLTGSLSRTDTGQNFNINIFFFSVAADIYRYALTLTSPLTLTAGTYWLSIVNDTSNDANDDWYWMTADANSGNARRRASDGQSWSDGLGDEMAFRISGTASSPSPSPLPEPGTLLLVAVGLTGWRLFPRASKD